MLAAMFLNLKEIVKWFGMTTFEIWVHLVSILIFSILMVLKLEGVSTMTWWSTFSPLFIADGLNSYFCIIVFIRQFEDFSFRMAGGRLLSSMLIISLLFVFKFLLCQKLSDRFSTYSHTEVIVPLFLLLVVLSIRSCQPRS
ncbi:hypothetical protein DPMN_006768 [Dreissena polymorpha]|uniref:Transmembrane protein 203 n=1 Tax=Dreissena polymorpha TaxID=45954 RepID=A0A9D4RXS1_DREPO|nr:hypothetical protein DPMN_006768 [Dreissena polymorpha]